MARLRFEGTVDVQTNAATGATVAQYRDPFGARAGSTPQAWGDGAGYMNKQVAEKTKLTNVGARTYDPVLGKFLSVDPVIDTNLPQQNTGYTYAGNNPTTYTDPTGMQFNIIANEPGPWWEMSSGKPAGHKKVAKQGKALRNKIDRFERRGPLSISSYDGDKDADARISRFYGTEQGQMLFSWLQGTSPVGLRYGPNAQMTKDIAGNRFTDEYRNLILRNLARGEALGGYSYSAGQPNPKTNPNFVRDMMAGLLLDYAPSADKTLLVLGSYDYQARVVERSGRSAVVSITASNSTQLGSMLRISDEAYRELNLVGPSLGLGQVFEEFSWTEEVSW